jgi:serine/threonine protein kinase
MNKDNRKTSTKSNDTNDKITKNKADFAYLTPFNYRIVKEIGRGGYGVVYKVMKFLCRLRKSVILTNYLLLR